MEYFVFNSLTRGWTISPPMYETPLKSTNCIQLKSPHGESKIDVMLNLLKSTRNCFLMDCVMARVEPLPL